MTPLRVAVSLRLFEKPLADSLISASRLGVQGVQLDVGDERQLRELSQTGRRHLVHDLDELGLSLASLRFVSEQQFMKPDNLDYRVKLCRDAMNLARDLETDVLILRPGRIPVADNQAEMDRLTGVLRDLAHHGNQLGIQLAIPSSAAEPSRLREILGSITTGPLGVDFDPAAFISSNQSALEAFGLLREIIVHCTARDAVAEADEGGAETVFGQGDVPWKQILALLLETRYDGWMTIERTRGNVKVRDAAHALALLQRMQAA
jgi:sugar phosphate isomerase/epimerase